MKQIKFITEKGAFLLVDDPILPQAMSITTKYIKLSEITEEQASEIVGIDIKHESVDINRLMLDTILQSKGVHLFENPYKNHQDKDLEAWYEELTFYNPFIFKL